MTFYTMFLIKIDNHIRTIISEKKILRNSEHNFFYEYLKKHSSQIFLCYRKPKVFSSLRCIYTGRYIITAQLPTIPL